MGIARSKVFFRGAFVWNLLGTALTFVTSGMAIGASKRSTLDLVARIAGASRIQHFIDFLWQEHPVLRFRECICFTSRLSTDLSFPTLLPCTVSGARSHVFDLVVKKQSSAATNLPQPWFPH